jgi:short-subunit dehydrogenase
VKATPARTILITGATGSIGSALARSYAAPGVCLILHGRQHDVLEGLAADCRDKGAVVTLHSFDLTDLDQLMRWGQTQDAAHGIDLLFANAGMNTNTGEHGEGEAWQVVSQLVDLNVKATMALVHSVLPGMRQRGHGQIALVSSLAGYFGLPVTPSYSASKAAVKAYGEALRGWLQPEGIRVNVIMPGYVDSRMCREMPGPKPFLWRPERAARVIRRGLERDKARISFPFLLSFGCWWLAVLPPALSIRILRLLDYRA